MPRKKINSGQSSVPVNILERMGRYFPEGYKKIFFEPLFDKTSKYDGNKYIPDEDLEKKIDSFMQSGESQFAYLVGYKGIGKSTVLKHYFNYLGEEVFLNNDNNSLYFTEYTWEYSSLSPSEELVEIPFRKLISQLSDKDDSENDKTERELWKYLQSRYKMLTEHNDSKPNSPMEQFKLKYGLIYKTRKLQLLLMKKGISSFVMALDNVEILTEDKRYGTLSLSKFIDVYRDLNDWTDFPDVQRPVIKLIISLRPDTCFELINPHTFNKIADCLIKKTSVLNMDKYFSLKIKSDPKFSEEWAGSPSFFIKISQKFNGKYNQIILGLSNHDINSSMKMYANIFSNETWMRIPSKKYENFFDAEALRINNITVIRALTCFEDEMFLCRKDSPTCNLLYSTWKEDYSIIVLYLMERFYLSRGTDNDYGADFIQKGQLIEQFSEIFRGIDKIEEMTESCIQYLLDAKILAKSCLVKFEEDACLEYDDCLYLTPRGITIWEMLTMDSVMLELFREDYYRTYQEEGNNNNPLCSKVLMEGQQQHELFRDLLRMIGEIFEREKEFYNTMLNNYTFTAFKSYFGEHSICHHLMSGVLKSMKYSGIYNNPDVKSDYDNLVQVLW